MQKSIRFGSGGCDKSCSTSTTLSRFYKDGAEMVSLGSCHVRGQVGYRCNQRHSVPKLLIIRQGPEQIVLCSSESGTDSHHGHRAKLG